MKNKLILATLITIIACSSCVQKTYKKTVVFTLTIKGIKDIKTVGIRGNGKPFSWDSDFEMKPIIKDSIYTATATTITGYKFAEVKFTINGEYELKEKPNRRVELSDKDTTYYNAVFDVSK
jgi:hypothetical protein